MSSRERLRDLYDGGEKEMARDFARAVLQNQSVDGYSVNKSTVTVETELFVGTHDIVTDDLDNPVVEEKGKYRVKMDSVNLTFPARSALSRVIDEVEDSIAEMDDVTPKPTPA